MPQFISYIRVSTDKQGRSGLGLEAQVDAVARFVAAKPDAVLLEQFLDVESGKGADALDRRPNLRAALAACRRTGATLLIAKLDRLARNVHFVSGLLESGCDFIAVDMPSANKVMIQMFAVMSEWERDQIAARTKAALAAAKARGVQLGRAGAANLKPNIEQRKHAADEFAGRLSGVLAGFTAAGMSQRDQVHELNRLGVKTARGGEWGQVQLQRVAARVRVMHADAAGRSDAPGAS